MGNDCTEMIMLLEKNETASNDTACYISLHKAELPVLLFLSFICNMAATINLISLLKSMKSKNLWLLIILAANDMFSSGTLLISMIANTFSCNLFQHNQFCAILGFLGLTSFGLSLNLVALISFERCLMIVFPIYHHTKLKIEKLIMLVMLCIGVNMILVGLPFLEVGAPYIYYQDNKICAFHWSAWGQNDAAHAQLVLFNGIYILLIVIVIVVLNITTYISLKLRARRLSEHVSSTLPSTFIKASKFTRLITVVAVVNCVCSLPFSLKIIIDYCMREDNIEELEDSITSILLFLTPIINPFLYLIFNKSYRQNLLKILLHFKCCHNNRVHPIPAINNANQLD